MTSKEIRQAFLDFFQSRQHAIVPSAPMVIKNDPTLMFTNAGMNQFKDFFLGNSVPKHKRVADTQKCLRVSGKHNDLEEVGIDTYHHTMFEMLGNWSFGDYFKDDAIAWAWELLIDVYKLPVDRLYVSVFEGDMAEKLDFDQASYDFWKRHIAEDRIVRGNKKDNFWEMGDTGPCGPCSEIHIDLRSEAERAVIDGKSLVNTGHPQVIEIWNNVFMEFNRKADSSLEKLPAQHVDTGMGLERLVMALQGKTSNYDTDLFQPMIQKVAQWSGVNYGAAESTDIAMRVIADHIRAIAFAIADGQLPSNNKAGYVIRRILRRAVRYGYTFLSFREPFLHRLVTVLAEGFAGVFDELNNQHEFIAKVIREEEASFLRTLGAGIQRFEANKANPIPGEFTFELYDTYGFPVDLTQLLAREAGKKVDMEGFAREMEKQKARSRQAAAVDTDDWVVVTPGEETQFVGYEMLEAEVEVMKYRKVKAKGKEQYQVVFNRTPFYAESGGQVGDTGTLSSEGKSYRVTDTQKENNLSVHYVDKLPENTSLTFVASVDGGRRRLITGNHSATHLLHAALRNVLGSHVVQKGSLVDDHHTRFDFAHFAKVTVEEITKIEAMVNEQIRNNIKLDERRDVPIADAMAMGAMALFGEKYGDHVRVITFDPEYSVELCGGTHVKATGEIALLKIVTETSVAAGVRRIEAITADRALQYLNDQLATVSTVQQMLNNPKDVVKGVQELLDQQQALEDKLEKIMVEKTHQIKTELMATITDSNGVNVVTRKIELPSADAIKNLCYEMKRSVDNLYMVLGSEIDGKAHLSVIISDTLVADRKLDAGKIVRDLAREIEGGGGGQAFYATAGGKNPAGLDAALARAAAFLGQ